MSISDPHPAPLPTSLPAIGIVSDLTDAERADLWYYGELITHQKGDVVVEQGVTQAFLHLVLEGEFRIVVKSEESIVPLGYPQAGECVGELSLLEPVEASATVLANATTHDWCISRERFDEYTHAHPVSAIKLLKAIAILIGSRLRKGSERLLTAEAEA